MTDVAPGTNAVVRFDDSKSAPKGRIVQAKDQARHQIEVIGRLVNLAARLCSRASAGQILVSEAVKIELGEKTALRPLPPISLKGLPCPVAVFEVSMAAASGD